MVTKKQLKRDVELLTNSLSESILFELDLMDKNSDYVKELVLEREKNEYLVDALDTITLGMFSHITKREDLSEEVIEGIIKSIEEQL